MASSSRELIWMRKNKAKPRRSHNLHPRYKSKTTLANSHNKNRPNNSQSRPRKRSKKARCKHTFSNSAGNSNLPPPNQTTCKGSTTSTTRCANSTATKSSGTIISGTNCHWPIMRSLPRILTSCKCTLRTMSVRRKHSEVVVLVLSF